MEDERHVQRAAVNEIPMRVFAVVAQALAVIGEQHHQRAPVQPRSRQEIKKATKRVIHVSQFLVVLALRGAGAVSGGRVVGLVKIKQVDEEQEGAAGILLRANVPRRPALGMRDASGRAHP